MLPQRPESYFGIDNIENGPKGLILSFRYEELAKVTEYNSFLNTTPMLMTDTLQRAASLIRLPANASSDSNRTHTSSEIDRHDMRHAACSILTFANGRHAKIPKPQK
jgi:hypothetical protein